MLVQVQIKSLLRQIPNIKTVSRSSFNHYILLCLIASLKCSSSYFWSHSHIHDAWNSWHTLRNRLTRNQWLSLLSLKTNILLFLPVLLTLTWTHNSHWSRLLHHMLLSINLLLLKLHLLHHLVVIHNGINNHLLIWLIHLLQWNTRLHDHLSRVLWHILLLFHWLRRLLLS